ncbi:ABC transporter ATP-binding protein [Halococcus sp. IIIV-5B]|uniref:ABC transporter ATP-binding protein n=1 Tax=Halococcus sp. IIIV-5B TaxID=2321230 RepID=UPI000E738433|nr:ABC transporter ATP-binding protein [Halococcus sp. IIIV-5B]RJT07036.1 ABC transporter ATP-binding protein [Halococcus sp. IIIV-5B]
MVSSPLAIETTDLTKRYRRTIAVDGLGLTVKSNEIYGFLGANGAGKSTTIGLLLDYFRPTSGSARVLGHDSRDVVAVHDRVGVLPDRFGVYEDLSGRAHVRFVADTKRTDDDPGELLTRVGLSDAADQEAGGYSQGMQQRLGLAMALVGAPDLLILDEPFTGLDPHGVRRIREVIREEHDRGASVFFSSHTLNEVQRVCDRAGILEQGRLIAEGSLAELREQAGCEADADMEDVFVALASDRAGGEVQ